MFQVPFYSDPPEDESWKDLEVGDTAKVKRRCPFRPGETGKIMGIEKDKSCYYVQFADGQVIGYDGDDLRLVKKGSDEG